jgi:hypothetical protein
MNVRFMLIKVSSNKNRPFAVDQRTKASIAFTSVAVNANDSILATGTEKSSGVDASIFLWWVSLFLDIEF